MKAYEIGLFLFIFQVIGGVMVAYLPEFGFEQGIISFNYNEQQTLLAQQQVEQTLSITQGQQVSPSDPLSASLGWFYSQITNAVSNMIRSIPVFRAIFWIPLILQLIGVPGPLAWAVFLIVNTIMLVGILQLISGRGLKQYD